MKNYNKLAEELGENRVLKKEPLSKYTSIKIGGPADLFFEPQTSGDLVKAIKLSNKYKAPFFIMGGGTNLLVSDKGFRGLVIRNKTSRIQPVKITGKGVVDDVFIKIDSGVQVNRLVRYCLDEGLAGLEYFLGQPGAVGGAVWINAHNIKAGNKFFGDSIVQAELIDKKGEIKTVPASYFSFGYDKSSIQETGEIVLTVTIKLRRADKDKLWQKAKKTLIHRRESQPFNFSSSGCVFRNPSGPFSSGYLIDKTGLKGKQIGGARISEKHAGFIINAGNAKAKDVIELIDLVKKSVKKKYNINLKEEIVLVGEF